MTDDNGSRFITQLILFVGLFIVGMVISLSSNNPIIQAIGILLIIMGLIIDIVVFGKLQMVKHGPIDIRDRQKYGIWPYGPRVLERKWSSRKGRPVYYYRNKWRW